MIKNSPLLSWKTVSICSVLSRARECPSASSRSCPLIRWEHQPRAFFSSDFISPTPQAYPHRSILQLCNHFNHVCHSRLNHFQFIYIPRKHFCPQLNTRVRQKWPELRIGGEQFPGSWLLWFWDRCYPRNAAALPSRWEGQQSAGSAAIPRQLYVLYLS